MTKFRQAWEIAHLLFLMLAAQQTHLESLWKLLMVLWNCDGLWKLPVEIHSNGLPCVCVHTHTEKGRTNRGEQCRIFSLLYPTPSFTDNLPKVAQLRGGMKINLTESSIGMERVTKNTSVSKNLYTYVVTYDTVSYTDPLQMKQISSSQPPQKGVD